MNKIGTKYCGCYADATGYGEANRNYIFALDQVGINVSTQKVQYTKEYSIHGKEHELCRTLENKDIQYDIKIVHVPCDNYLKHLEPCKYHIGHLFWETDKMAPEWVWNCNLMDEIWVGDEYHKGVFMDSGVKRPIYVMPQPIDIDLADEKYAKFKIEGQKEFLFYSIFQWIERKNYRGLLEAYYKEFNNGENVGLLLKTYREFYTNDERDKIREDINKIKRGFGNKYPPSVYLHVGLQTKHDVMRIHTSGDCYVLPHRGEGFGRTILEAMLMGKPTIATNFGGIHEFLTKEIYYPLDFKMIKVFNMEFAPWYAKDQQWAEPNVGQLRKYLRYVFENRDEAKGRGKLGQDFIKRNFSFEAVGRMMKDRLLDIQKMIDGERKNKIRWLPRI